MEATGPLFCRCLVVRGRIQFCPLHEHAGTLLAACQYLRGVLSKLRVEQSDASLIREVVLPHVDDAIRRAIEGQPHQK